MDDLVVRKWTAWAGIAFTVLGFASVPLYFVHDGPPPLSNVQLRAFIGLLSIAALIVFFSGLRHLLRRANAALEWPASLFHATGMLLVAVLFITVAHETGVAYGAPDGSLDPTTDGPLAHANILLHGSVKRLLTTMLLFAGGFASVRAGLVPKWLGWFAYFIALCNAAFIPSLFASTDVTKFYSTHGWGNSALCGSLIAYWTLGVGIALLRRK
jgi:hypothetical protein